MAAPLEKKHITQNYYVNRRPEMLPFVPVSARRVLDVGCGEGLFAESVKDRGAEVWGVELAERPAKMASERIDRVICGDARDVLPTLPEGTFDCVVFNDVLEHVDNPQALLNRARQLLTEDGVVVCSIPNVRYYRVLLDLVLHKQWRYVDAGILDRTHLRFYTERSIPELFAETGYELLVMKGIGGFTSWKYRLIQKLSLGWLSDVFHYQFGCVGKPIRQREQLSG